MLSYNGWDIKLVLYNQLFQSLYSLPYYHRRLLLNHNPSIISNAWAFT